MGRSAARWMVLAGLCGTAGMGWGQAALAVPKLDLHQFLGEWYQIARLPDKPEKQCQANNFLLFARDQKTMHFQEVQSCTIKGGSNQVRNNAGLQNKAGDGKLGITYLYFLHHKLWVVGVAPDSSWALLGTPNHKQLALLSRTSTMKPEVEADVKAKAAAQGYNVGKMIEVTQNDTELRKRVTTVVSTTGK